MLKKLLIVDEYANFNNPNGSSLKYMEAKIKKAEDDKKKLINPKYIFEGSKFNKLKNGSKYKAPKPKDGKKKPLIKEGIFD